MHGNSNIKKKVRQVFLDKSAELRNPTINFVTSLCPSIRLSVRPHGTTRLPFDEFSLNLILRIFIKFDIENFH